MSQSKSLKKQKKKLDFSDMSRFDAVAMVANTAVVARDSGHPVTVRHARIQGERGILVFIPGFELIDGNLKLVEEAPIASAVNGVEK